VAFTLAQGQQVLNDANYVARIRGAMIRGAVAVSTEVQGSLTANAWLKRRQLAIRILNNPDSYTADFAAGFAADPNTSLTWFKPLNIVSSTNVDPSVVTTATHSLTTGDVVSIDAHLVNTNINGVWVVTVVSATTFSVPMPGNGAGVATGKITRQETDANIAFTVNSLFSAIAGLLPGE
jgi:hypothetical protein